MSEIKKMFNITKIKPNLNWRNLSKLSFILLGTSIMFTGISLLALKPKQTQAQAIQVASNWQQASFPVENFQAYTSGFGYRVNPVTGSRQFHQGLDLAAPMGSYVRSWWSGQVTSVSDHTACGTMIQITSGNWTHVYCHLMGSVEETDRGRVFVDRSGGLVLWEGQPVPAGARIARVGMSGRTTGPHLHWGLKYDGNYIDPAAVLRQMFAQQS